MNVTDTKYTRNDGNGSKLELEIESDGIAYRVVVRLGIKRSMTITPRPMSGFGITMDLANDYRPIGEILPRLIAVYAKG